MPLKVDSPHLWLTFSPPEIFVNGQPPMQRTFRKFIPSTGELGREGVPTMNLFCEKDQTFRLQVALILIINFKSILFFFDEEY